ncbi:MAG: hypothetical protein Q8R86_04570 [Sulfuricurvum sp.]|nr:hypothetical protein [Sulfuricurvum sp.]
MIDTNIVVKNLLVNLNLKSEAELANKLGMTKNAFSMLKQRNSIGTLIERLLKLEEIEKISFDYILTENTNSKNIFLLSKKICNVFSEAEIKRVEIDLRNNLDDQENLQQILEKFKTLKGVGFATKLSEMLHGRGERMSVILYQFLQHITDKVLIPVEKEYAKRNFINALKSFEQRGLYGLLFTDQDKKNLLNWLEHELDDDDYYMILSDITGMAEKLKPLLNIFNRPMV